MRVIKIWTMMICILCLFLCPLNIFLVDIRKTNQTYRIYDPFSYLPPKRVQNYFGQASTKSWVSYLPKCVQNYVGQTSTKSWVSGVCSDLKSIETFTIGSRIVLMMTMMMMKVLMTLTMTMTMNNDDNDNHHHQRKTSSDVGFGGHHWNFTYYGDDNHDESSSSIVSIISTNPITAYAILFATLVALHFTPVSEWASE